MADIELSKMMDRIRENPSSLIPKGDPRDSVRMDAELYRSRMFGVSVGESTEDLNEDLTLSDGDKKVLNAFLDRKEASGKKFDVEKFGDKLQLDGLWMGGKGIAYWKNGKIYLRPSSSRSEQTVHNFLKKNGAKNDFATEPANENNQVQENDDIFRIKPHEAGISEEFIDAVMQEFSTASGLKFDTTSQNVAANGSRYIKAISPKGKLLLGVAYISKEPTGVKITSANGMFDRPGSIGSSDDPVWLLKKCIKKVIVDDKFIP